MITINSIINTSRWTLALERARSLRPWVRSLGNGAYRVARRPTDRDLGFRAHIVQFSAAGDRCFVQCDCDAARFENICYHAVAAYLRAVRRAQRRERLAA